MGMSISVCKSVSVSVRHPLQHSSKMLSFEAPLEGLFKILYSASLGGSSRVPPRISSRFRCDNSVSVIVSMNVSIIVKVSEFI